MQKSPPTPPLSVTRRHFSNAEEPDSPTAAGTAETVAGARIFSQLLHLNAARRLRDERVRAGLLAFDVIMAGWGGCCGFFSRRDSSGKLFFFCTRGSSRRSATSVRVCEATWHMEHLFPATPPPQTFYFLYFTCFSVWFLPHFSPLCRWS